MTPPPRLEYIGPLELTGLLQRHRRDVDLYTLIRGIGRQWDEYMTRRAAPPWTPDAWRYGVTLRIFDGDTTVPYFCGAPPPAPREERAGFVTLNIPAQPFAVFVFDGHISEFRDFFHAVFTKDLPEAGFRPAPDGDGVPEFVERYDWRFEPSTGRGGFDLLIPVAI